MGAENSQNVGAPRQEGKGLVDRLLESLIGPPKIFKYRAQWSTYVPYSQDRRGGFEQYVKDFETQFELNEFVQTGLEKYQIKFRTFTLIPRDGYEAIETTGMIPIV